MSANLKTRRPTYASIDLENYGHNLEQARLLSGSEIIAVIKADAYGHGAVRVGEHGVSHCRVKKLAVATIAEALELREHLGDRADIQVFGFVGEAFFREAVENNIVLTIYDEDFARSFHSYLAANNLQSDVVLKIETGMNRLGYDTSLIPAAFIKDHPRFDLKMIMTHMPSADTDVDYSRKQIAAFKNYLTSHNVTVPGSMFNSSAICNFENPFDYVRPGIMSYGYVGGNDSVDLKPVMKIYSKIVHVKQLGRGNCISYNHTFTADRDMVIGVIPMGYADGYPRALSNKAHMKVGDHLCPVVGRVCMDMTMIDISDVPKSDYSSEVEVMGDSITADDWAGWADTISYEVLCGISKRIPRIYR